MYLKMDTHKVTHLLVACLVSHMLALTAIVLSGKLKCCARHEVTAAAAGASAGDRRSHSFAPDRSGVQVDCDASLAPLSPSQGFFKATSLPRSLSLLGASEFDAAYLAPLYPQQVTPK